MALRDEFLAVASLLSVAATSFLGCGGRVEPSPVASFSISQWPGHPGDGSASPPGSYWYTAGGSVQPEPPPPRSGATCTTTRAGECAVTVCDFTDYPTTDPYTHQHSLNAGAVTITGRASSIVLAYPEDSSPFAYYGYGATQLFKGGETVTLSGAGGPDLPAFAERSVVAPNDIVLTTPDCTGACAPIDRTKDLAMVWTEGGSGTVHGTLSSISQRKTVDASCDFEAASGRGIVPVAILVKLEDNLGAVFFPVNEAHFIVDGAETTFRVEGIAYGAFGNSK